MLVWIIRILAGVIVWISAYIWFSMRSVQGTLRIDHSDPEKDVYRLEISNLDLNDLSKKKKITLKVDNNADLSR